MKYGTVPEDYPADLTNSNEIKITKTIEIELERYKEWITELEILVKVGNVLTLYEESGCTDYELIVKEISKIVFKED